MSASIRSQRVRRIPSGRTNKSLRSLRVGGGAAMPRLKSPAVATSSSPWSTARSRTPTGDAPHATGQPGTAIGQSRGGTAARRQRPATPGNALRAAHRSGGVDTDGGADPASVPQVSARRPRTAPSPGREVDRSSGSRMRSGVYNISVDTGAPGGNGATAGASRAGKRASDAAAAAADGGGGNETSRRSSGSSAEIREAVNDTENQEDLPAMFQLNERKQRLLQQHQYEVLWKRAQQKLTTQLYARYPTLVAMFRAFDEDKDGHITYDEFEGRIKKMWDPAHYVGWEARVLFNSVRKPGSDVITFPEMQGLFKSSPKTLPGSMYKMDGTAVQTKGSTAEEEAQLQTTQKRIYEIKQKLIQKVQQKQKLTKAYRKDTQYLLQTFRQFDTNMNGVLSYGEVRDALGPQNLNLGLSDREVLDLCLHADAEDTGAITYSNFLTALSTVDVDRNYDPFKVGRVMDVQCMRRYVGMEYMEDPSDEASRFIKPPPSPSSCSPTSRRGSFTDDPVAKQYTIESPTRGSERMEITGGVMPGGILSARRRSNLGGRSATPGPWSGRGADSRRDLRSSASSRPASSAGGLATGGRSVAESHRRRKGMARSRSMPGSRRSSRSRVEPQTAPSKVDMAPLDTRGAGMGGDRGSSTSSVGAVSYYAPDAERTARAESRRMTQAAWEPSPQEMGETFAWSAYVPPPTVPRVMAATPQLASTLSRSGGIRNTHQDPAWAYQTTPSLKESLRRSRSGRLGGGNGSNPTRPETSPNPLFSQLRRNVPPHATRFSANPPRKETGGRVGVGGRGPNARSAFYMQEPDRFVTTTKTLFSKQQDVVESGSISRQMAASRSQQRLARTQILKSHKTRLRDSIKAEERRARHADRVRVKTKSRQRLRYLEHLDDVERATQIIKAGTGLLGMGTPSTRNESSDWFAHRI